jgi:threonine aldolase
MAALSGVAPLSVSAPRGHLTADHISQAQRTRIVNRPEVALVVLENTANLAGGTVADSDLMRATIGAAHEAGLRVHVDGARIWNAAVAKGVEPREVARGADTLMACLSKGLSCPVGSLLFCSKDRIGEARRHRQLFGGGMRQAGVLAAAGRVALARMRGRLADDHAHARILFDALASVPGVNATAPETNIVVADLGHRMAADVVGALGARGILAGALGRHTLRIVTHNDVTSEDCERAASVLREVLA